MSINEMKTTGVTVGDLRKLIEGLPDSVPLRIDVYFKDELIDIPDGLGVCVETRCDLEPTVYVRCELCELCDFPKTTCPMGAST